MNTTATSAADLASRLHLHRAGREWRGSCPACGYGSDAFTLSTRNGRLLGWCSSCRDKSAIGRLLRGDTAPVQPQDKADAAGSRERAQARALALWAGADPATGTIADAYLTGRALPGLAACVALRFRGDCSHPEGGKLPALVALVADQDGKPVGVHRTYLRRDGSGKADATPVKASLGPIWGGAIRLDPVAPELVIGEGIETSASAGRLLGLPAWAAISAGNLARGLVLPVEVRAVVIAADADEPGERAAREAALRWQREGRKVRVARPDQAGRDFNDVLRARAGGV